MVDNETIIDPSEGYKLPHVNTPFYLGRLFYRAAELGITKQVNPIPYKNAIEQIEIFVAGHRSIVEKPKEKTDYPREKQKLKDKYTKIANEIQKGYNSDLKESKRNRKIERNMANLEIQYYSELHSLLSKYLAPLKWKIWKVDRI